MAVTATTTDLDNYIVQARSKATPTPTPTPEPGSPLSRTQLFVYVWAPVDSVVADGPGATCKVHDGGLDQELDWQSPFAIASEDGTIVEEGLVKDAVSFSWVQNAIQSETSDARWASSGDTRICRLGAGVCIAGYVDCTFKLSYSPVYQVVVGPRALGPYEVKWNEIVAGGQRLILDIDLRPKTTEPVPSPVAAFGRNDTNSPTIEKTITEPITVHNESVLIDLTTRGGESGSTKVWVIPESGERTLVFEVPFDTPYEEFVHPKFLVTTIDAQIGERIRFEVEAAPPGR